MTNLSDTKKIAEKRMRDQRVVEAMIRMYCKGVHHASSVPCPSCQALIDYCRVRVEHCPREAEKTFCSSCPHPCYAPRMRQQIKVVMRWAGPRMLFHHPILLIRHAFDR